MTVTWYVVYLMLTVVLIWPKAFSWTERPSVRRLIRYLNPKVQDVDIPKKTCISEAVTEKARRLDEKNRDLISVWFPK